jgi:hypothetical protein
VAQLVLVIEILAVERDPEYALRQQGPHFKLNQILTPPIVKAGAATI